MTDTPEDNEPTPPGPAETDNDLITELHSAINQATAQVLNRQAPDCPPLYWSPSSTGRSRRGASGLAGSGYSPDGAVAAVMRWVERFGLRAETPLPGMISYHGQVNGLPVTVWAITDHDAFYTHLSRPVSARKARVKHPEPKEGRSRR
jgi:hypothetical protein